MLRSAMLVSCLAAASSLLGHLSAQVHPPSASVDTGANLAPRPIGTGDLLVISIYGSPELSRPARVSQEGSIRLPMLKKPVEARGITPAELEQRVAEALAEAGILVDPEVVITIAEYATHPIRVAGAVRHPLTFDATGPVTLLEALTRAEGLSGEAGADILVTRTSPDTRPGGGPVKDPLTTRIAVKDLIEKADPAANVILEGGEEVRVPEAGRVFVVGNVKKPGAFPVGDGSGISVLKALALAEGLAPFSTKLAYIYRPRDGGKQEIEVSLRKIMERKSPDVVLAAGDIFYIPDNRGGRVTASVIEKAVAFAAGTASGALILGLNR
ncbi:MAG: polysaccharide biosynthesis/export family protein [Acidobacteriia bacterium]|nr:polysaccharide biosynthesis/export family protein [Terriglobia bacterium]